MLEKEVDGGGRHVIYGMMGIVTEEVMERLEEVRQSLVKGGEGSNEHLKVVDQAIEAIEAADRQLEEWLEEGGERMSLEEQVERQVGYFIRSLERRGQEVDEGLVRLVVEKVLEIMRKGRVRKKDYERLGKLVMELVGWQMLKPEEVGKEFMSQVMERVKRG